MKEGKSRIILLVLFIIAVFVGILGFINTNNNLYALNMKSKFFNISDKGPKNKDDFFSKLKDNRIKNNNINLLVIGDNMGKSMISKEAESQSQWYNKFIKYLNSTYNVNVKLNMIISPDLTVFSAWANYHTYKKPDADLVLILIGKNDQYLFNENQFAAFYESLIRSIKFQNPNTEIVLMADRSLTNVVSNDKAELIISIIKNLRTKYGTMIVDSITDYGLSDNMNIELTDKDLPNDDGDDLYYNALKKKFENRFKAAKLGHYTAKKITPEKKPLFSESIKYGRMNFINNFMVKSGFDLSEKINSQLLVNYNSTEEEVAFVDSKPGSSMEFSVGKSNLLAGSFVTGPDFGMIKVYVDGIVKKDIDLYTPDILKKNVVITDKLLAGSNHTVKVVVSNAKNPASNGFNVKIFGLITN